MEGISHPQIKMGRRDAKELVELELRPWAVIRLYDNFECAGAESATLNSHYVGGHPAGLGSEFFDKRVAVEERGCLAKGDDRSEFLGVEQP